MQNHLSVKVGGHWDVTCIDGKTRAVKWVEHTHNVITNQGLNYLLNVAFEGVTQLTTFYIAPFNDDSTVTASHTYAAPGYTEATAYDEAGRVVFNSASAAMSSGATGSITNSANQATFTLNASMVMYGCGLVGGTSDATVKGDTAAGGAILFCGNRFSTSRTVQSGDKIQVTYNLGATDDGV